MIKTLSTVLSLDCGSIPEKFITGTQSAVHLIQAQINLIHKYVDGVEEPASIFSVHSVFEEATEKHSKT